MPLTASTASIAAPQRVSSRSACSSARGRRSAGRGWRGTMTVFAGLVEAASSYTGATTRRRQRRPVFSLFTISGGRVLVLMSRYRLRVTLLLDQEIDAPERRVERVVRRVAAPLVHADRTAGLVAI